MLNRKGSFSRGDTLIEVLFAVTVFSLVAVGTFSIMNQGTAVAQRSLEITLVRQEIDGQAETLRFIHDSYVAAYPNITTGPAAEWTKITDKSVPSASQFGTCPTSLPSGAFILNTKTAKLEPESKISFDVPTFSQLRYDPTSPATTPPSTGAVLSDSGGAQGLWIEAVRSAASGGSGFVDFHIRACWQSANQTVPMTLGTIVRLYEPRP